RPLAALRPGAAARAAADVALLDRCLDPGLVRHVEIGRGAGLALDPEPDGARGAHGAGPIVVATVDVDAVRAGRARAAEEQLGPLAGDVHRAGERREPDPPDHDLDGARGAPIRPRRRHDHDAVAIG